MTLPSGGTGAVRQGEMLGSLTVFFVCLKALSDGRFLVLFCGWLGIFFKGDLS